MDECAVIEIFGSSDDAKAIVGVAEDAELDGMALDWNTYSPSEEIIEAMIEASQEGEWLRLVCDDCDDLDHIRKACREANLCYILSRGISGDEGYHSATYWRPGFEEEHTAGLVDGITLAIPYEEIRQAAAVGMEAVRTLLTDFERNTLVHVEKRLRLSPEVASELKGAASSP